MDDIPYIEKYKRICQQAATQDDVFQTFRKHDDYTPMLEHVSYEQGLQYLKVVEDRNPQLLQHLDKFKENDKWGSPQTFDYYKVGVVSPTTLRYIKVLSDLIEMFESVEGENVIELGGGYGGQCRIISCLFNFNSYTIVDLPEVTPLINRYLTGVPNAKATTLPELTDGASYDLFISNYAFTELPKALQAEYLKKVVNRSTHGYITCNFISEDCGVTSMGKDEMLKQLEHEYTIIDEFPKTHPKNFLLVW